MGRKTLFSFKDKMPLKNRINIVFTTNDSLKNEYVNANDIYFVKTIDDLNEVLDKYKDKKVFVIGGASIYEKILFLCDTCLITQVYKEFGADTFFPDLEKNGFMRTEESEKFIYEGVAYKFLTYKKF